MRAGITGAFGAQGENDNRRKVVDFYAERGLCVGNSSKLGWLDPKMERR